MRYFLSIAFICSGLSAAVTVAHNDAGQTGSNTLETSLTTSNVTVGKFGKLGSWSITGDAFSQTLAVPASISGLSHDMLIVATLGNNVYAFDANAPGTAALWTASFGTGRAWWSNNTDQFYYTTSNIGISGTPVVDATGGFVYVVAVTSTPSYVLHKLKLVDGTDAVTAVTISGQVTGTGSTGDPTSGANLLFSATLSNQRPGLALSPDSSKVYVTFGGGSAGASNPPWHGWVFAYATSALTQTAVFCTTPNGWGGSIWMSGGAPAIDASGNVYVLTGAEGVWDGSTNFSDSMLKLSPSLALLDWFTPSNHATLDADDYDFGSGRVMLVPGTTLAVGAGKDFNVYAVDTTCMGHLQGSGFGGCTLQTFPTLSGGTVSQFSGSYGGAVTSSRLFLPTTAGSLYEFAFASGSYNTTPTATQTNSYGFPGPAQMSVSSNSGSNAILWAVTTPTNTFTSIGEGTLRAINASTLSELWNSGTTGTDTLGNMAKFVSPTVSNGRVYVPTNDGTVVVYGLLPSAATRGAVTVRGQAAVR